MRNRILLILAASVGMGVLAVGIYFFPPVHSRLAWRVDTLRTQIKYYFNPPEQAIFQPAQQVQVDTIVQLTMQALQSTPTETATPLPTSPGPTVTPTITPTPLPSSVILSGVKYEDQHNRWNYCGPANYAMALTFWGWKGNRDLIGKAVKPSDKDKNVMPYEFQNYISANVPGMGSVIRVGGDAELVKRLIANGFPVVAEKGYYERDYTGRMGWLGHYLFTTGYDDAKGVFIVQDSYLIPGKDLEVPYNEYIDGWRSFNYLFTVVYPLEREVEVMSLLGPYVDNTWAARRALEIAKAESASMTGIDQFFAWFNRGSSHVALFEYFDGAVAYDEAFRLYANLAKDDTTRPYRIMWYQTGPYWAYYYTNRYQDVVNLATTTLNETIAEPVLEESLYWRARALYMLGDTNGAVNDLRASLSITPNFAASLEMLRSLGIQP